MSGLYASTLSGVLTPRRFVPFVLVAGPLLLAQSRLSRGFSSRLLGTAAPTLLGILMLLAFVLFAPYLWRVFGPNGRWWWRGLGLVLYAACGAALVFGIGYTLARGSGLRTLFMTAQE